MIAKKYLDQKYLFELMNIFRPKNIIANLIS